MKNEDKGKSGSMCGESNASQKGSVRAVPASTSGHNNPDITPVGGKAMTGAKIN